jgi:hypothetical protein
VNEHYKGNYKFLDLPTRIAQISHPFSDEWRELKMAGLGLNSATESAAHIVESTSDVADRTSDNAAFEAAKASPASRGSKLPKEEQRYDYAVNPPIRLLSQNEVKGATLEFGHSIDSYFRPDERSKDQIANSPFPAETKVWNAKASGAQRFGLTASFTPHSPTHVYSFNGRPVGILQMSHDSDKSIVHAIAAHNGTSQGGETLFSYAVNESQRNNHGGRLHLAAVPESRGFFESLGFTKPQKNEKFMFLDPSTRPDIWTKDESTQRWTLNKYASRGYLSPNPLYKGKS